MKRGWGAEVVGWTAALVLLLGIGVVATGVVDEDPPRRPVVADLPSDTPVVVAPAVAPVTSSPSPTPRPAATAKPARATGNGLGPPPGAYPDKAPTRFAAPEDRYAFLVGVQHYRSPTHDTVASVNDVVMIRQALLAAGWLPQNIKVVVDEQATGDAIRSGLAWLASVGEPAKTFTFFHYSGHVKQFGGQTEALWPIDRDWVRDTQFAQLVNRIPGRMWVDIAGCEAASFMPGVPTSTRLFSSSSKATQKSYENPAWNASVWTGLLFGYAPSQADADRDGTVVVGEALRYAQYYAQLVTLEQRPHGRQTPQLAGDDVRGWTLSNPPA